MSNQIIPGQNDLPENGIYCGDSRLLSLAIQSDSIDMLITDPLYHAKHLHYYGWVAEVGARVLKPGAWAFIYGGWITKEVFDLLYDKGLDYFMTIALVNKHGYPRWWSKRLMIGFKPIYVFTKGTPTISKWQANIADSDMIDKRYHAFGQGTGFVIEKIDMFTKPGDIIFDPFCGGGQVAAAAVVTGRKYITFDIDEQSVVGARKRIRTMQKPLVIPEPQVLTLERKTYDEDYEELIS